MLSPYRVLDLTDHRGELAGLLLADLGADVIRVEPPQGSEARRRGPRIEAASELDGSLQFFAFNQGKRSIALDLDAASDRDVFLKLVGTSDFVLESAPPGSLAEHGLSFESLRAANPRIVHVQITPFGSDGPHAAHAATDLTLASMGGPVAVQGDAGRPPVRVSVPQAWRHAGAEAAVAALVAQARMRSTGEAQFVDVSAQCAMTWTMLNAMIASAVQGFDFERSGSAMQLGPVTYRIVFPCQDGHVVALGAGRTLATLVPWMLEEGRIDRAFAQQDWETYDQRRLHGEAVEVPVESLINALERFFLQHPKQELFERGLELGVTIAPVNTIEDLLRVRQLEARDAFAHVELPGGTRARVPGAFAKPSERSLRPRRPPPRLDEHGPEIRAELAAGTHATRAAPALEARRSALPLEGLKVADLTWIGVDPISTRYLADHGATVVKIESENRPDGLRSSGPFTDGKPGWNRSQFFGEFNTSKLSLCLDLKNPASIDVARRLIAWADVFMESYTPGAIERLGLGYEVARSLNPRIVMLSTCLMGQTGPHRQMAGYGYHAGAVAGYYEITGWPDRAPVGPYQAYTDTVAPRFVTATLLAAVDHARRSGQGQHIDLAQLEAGLQFLAPEILEYQVSGRIATRRGNRGDDAVPQGAYPCAGEDQWCAIAIETESQWQALCRALDAADWLTDPELADPASRAARHDELDARISAWTRVREPRSVMTLLQELGVPAGMVQRSSDLLRDPQLRHRGFHHPLQHPEMGLVPYSGHQFRIRGYPSGPRWPAPLLGQHSFQVLQEILELDDAAIAELVASGAVV